MHNPKHNETILITSSAMNGIQLMAWKEFHAPELKRFFRAQRVRP
jgi:hypothetical protein